jgi:hypothetical protein
VNPLSAPPVGAAWIRLTKGQHALVDITDYEAVIAAGPWHLYTPSKAGGRRKRLTHYARKVFYLPGGKRRSVYLHRWLWEHWGRPPTEHVDHDGGDGLDCRWSKLRAATHDQNQRARTYCNQLGVKGVNRDKRRFVARITVDGHRRVLGRFSTVLDAAAAYDRAARELHGEFARLNFAEAAA